MINDHRYAVSIYGGILGITTKSGLIPFLYHDFRDWVKKQVKKSKRNNRYLRLFSSSRKRLPVRKVRRKRSLCNIRKSRKNCRCSLVIIDWLGQESRQLFPTRDENRLWKISEYYRKKLKRKTDAGLLAKPACPKDIKCCPLEANHKVAEFMWVGEAWLSNSSDFVGEYTIKSFLTHDDDEPISWRQQYKHDACVPQLWNQDGIDAWLDSGRSVDELFALLQDPPEPETSEPVQPEVPESDATAPFFS
ncbi:MAG: hypothetical protein ACRC2T_20650 [Thermoguttaceae bacterium]